MKFSHREPIEIVRNPENKTFRILFGDNDFVTCYSCDMDNELIERAEIVSRGCLIQKEYYTYTKNFIEYYSPVDGRARLYQRTWLNEDGSVAYDYEFHFTVFWKRREYRYWYVYDTCHGGHARDHDE